MLALFFFKIKLNSFLTVVYYYVQRTIFQEVFQEDCVLYIGIFILHKYFKYLFLYGDNKVYG